MKLSTWKNRLGVAVLVAAAALTGVWLATLWVGPEREAFMRASETAVLLFGLCGLAYLSIPAGHRPPGPRAAETLRRVNTCLCRLERLSGALVPVAFVGVRFPLDDAGIRFSDHLRWACAALALTFLFAAARPVCRSWAGLRARVVQRPAPRPLGPRRRVLAAHSAAAFLLGLVTATASLIGLCWANDPGPILKTITKGALCLFLGGGLAYVVLTAGGLPLGPSRGPSAALRRVRVTRLLRLQAACRILWVTSGLVALRGSSGSMPVDAWGDLIVPSTATAWILILALGPVYLILEGMIQGLGGPGPGAEAAADRPGDPGVLRTPCSGATRPDAEPGVLLGRRKRGG